MLVIGAGGGRGRATEPADMTRGKGMRTRNTRRVAALAAAVLGAGLALASCADDSAAGVPRAAPGPEPTRPSARTWSSWPTSATCPGRPSVSTPPSSPRRTRPRRTPTSCSTDVHGRQGQLRGLQGVRGPARRCACRPATRRTSPSSRSPVCSRPWSRPARSSRRRPQVVRQRRRVLRRGLEDLRHASTASSTPPRWAPTSSPSSGTRRRCSPRTAGTVPHDLGRADGAVRHDRGHRHQAVVRRHRVR